MVSPLQPAARVPERRVSRSAPAPVAAMLPARYGAGQAIPGPGDTRRVRHLRDLRRVRTSYGYRVDGNSSMGTGAGGMTRRVSDVMTSGVRTLGPNDPLRLAARVMADLNVGSIPVCNGDRLVGVVTDRDITIRAVAEGFDVSSTPIARVMTVAPKYCFDTDPIEHASALMQQLQIRRLPVIDSDNKLAGIVTLGDIAVRGG